MQLSVCHCLFLIVSKMCIFILFIKTITYSWPVFLTVNGCLMFEMYNHTCQFCTSLMKIQNSLRHFSSLLTKQSNVMNVFYNDHSMK